MVYFVEDETFKKIANAIRKKTGMIDKITPLQMPYQILSILTEEEKDPEEIVARIVMRYFNIEQNELQPSIRFESFNMNFIDSGIIISEESS